MPIQITSKDTNRESKSPFYIPNRETLYQLIENAITIVMQKSESVISNSLKHDALYFPSLLHNVSFILLIAPLKNRNSEFISYHDYSSTKHLSEFASTSLEVLQQAVRQACPICAGDFQTTTTKTKAEHSIQVLDTESNHEAEIVRTESCKGKH